MSTQHCGEHDVGAALNTQDRLLQPVPCVSLTHSGPVSVRVLRGTKPIE